MIYKYILRLLHRFYSLVRTDSNCKVIKLYIILNVNINRIYISIIIAIIINYYYYYYY